MSPLPIRMVFFDIGNVLVSDDPSALFIYRRAFADYGEAMFGTPEAFFEARRASISAGATLWPFLKTVIPDAEFLPFQKSVRAELYADWQTFSPELPGMGDAVRAIAKQVRLGILANQPRQVDDLLKARGLHDLFEVHGISDALGMEKPQRAFFEWALREAGIPAEETLMVGDRIDNDVRPAKALGMQTLWLQLDYDARGWRPTDIFGELYAESMRAACVSHRKPTTPDDEPTYIARSAEELVALFESGAIATVPPEAAAI